MANHQSSEKRIRQTNVRRVHNKYYAKTTRNAIKELRGMKDKKEADELLPKVTSMLDKLSKINVIHKNKASNLKAKLTKHVNHLSN
jgi:small subunit ribosomal protein S20